ncbi:unnamed protein product [Staurois parvus]|uniref:Ribosomal protein L32 n=1 Tax=Staurois parvus TaxID=386267 RepID=A0ABN9F5Q8_9NEOB|nr:unnamed protein product [Staurois parvus]
MVFNHHWVFLLNKGKKTKSFEKKNVFLSFYYKILQTVSKKNSNEKKSLQN